MKALLIDPAARTIETVDIPCFDDVRQLYPILEVNRVEAVALPRGDYLYVDEEGLLKDDPGPFFQYMDYQPVPGRGLVAGVDGHGATRPPLHSLKLLRTLVSFPDVQLAGFESFEDMVNLFGLGLMPVFGTRAIFHRR